MTFTKQVLYIFILQTILSAIVTCHFKQDQSNGLYFLVDINEDNGEYSVNINGKVTLESKNIVGLQVDGVWYSPANNNMKLDSVTRDSGSDAIGEYWVYTFKWDLSGKPDFNFNTEIFVYDSGLDIVFRQDYIDGASNIQTGKGVDSISSSYPFFDLLDPSSSDQLAFYGYYGSFFWFGKSGLFNTKASNIPGGLAGGVPMILFDKQNISVIISPLNNFMVQQNSQIDKSVGFGIMGSMTSVLPGMQFDWHMHLSDSINKGFEEWGNIMRNYYNKTYDNLNNDFTNNYLGYWTDNGMCYWYNAGKDGYEKTMIDVIETGKKQGIPFGYLDIDSWWYYKETSKKDFSVIEGAMLNWTAKVDVFPHNLTYLQDQIQMPIFAHNRYFSSKSNYTKWFNFVVEQDYSLPMQFEFWDFLFSDSKQRWGLYAYEQDWLDFVMEHLNVVQTNITAGRQWLKLMNDAAVKNQIQIQYCMPYPKNLLQSLEFESVTKVRVSDDYGAVMTQWKIGITSMIAWNLGLAPFKNAFHTVFLEWHDCHYKHYPEFNAEREAAVAALSAGPIGPGDRIGNSNKDILLKTCMPDGRLLKPGVPAMAIDSQLIGLVFGKSYGPQGEAWRAYTVHGGLIYYNIFVSQFKYQYKLYPKELYPYQQNSMIAYEYVNKKLFKFDDNNPLVISKQWWFGSFKLFQVSPILSNNLAVLGELNKFVPMSKTRFGPVHVEDQGTIEMTVYGVSGEQVTISVYNAENSQIQEYKCTISSSGQNILTIPTGTCV